MSVSVERKGDSFVAEVQGVDLNQTLDEATWQAIHQAYLDHKVLVFRDQSLEPAHYAAFGERFGELVPHTMRKFRHTDYPEIMILSNRTEYGMPKGIRDAGSFWHSDFSYQQKTANATMLYALEIPDVGGDTIFADLSAAYDALSPMMQSQLATLRYRSEYRWSRDRTDPESRWLLLTEEERAENPEVEHPVVRTHPETGRKSLFVFPGISSGNKGIVGMAPAESEALLQTLYDHITEARFQYRFKWPGAGTLLLWDNRCTMHSATTKTLPADKFRTLYRISTLGDAPY